MEAPEEDIDLPRELFPSQNKRLKLALPVSETEIVEIGGIRCLLTVPVHLVINSDAIPTGGNEERRIGLVQDGSHAIQGD